MYIEKLAEFWFSIFRSEPTLRRNMQSSWNSGVISGRASFKKVRAKTTHLNYTVFYIQDYRIRIMPWTANITKSQTVCSNWRENQPFWERPLEWAHGRGMREWRRLLAVYPFHLWQSFNQKMLKISNVNEEEFEETIQLNHSQSSWVDMYEERLEPVLELNNKYSGSFVP